jgi:hypothetical protein
LGSTSGSTTVPCEGDPAFAGPPLVVHAVAGLAGAAPPGDAGAEVVVVGDPHWFWRAHAAHATTTITAAIHHDLRSIVIYLAHWDATLLPGR